MTEFGRDLVMMERRSLRFEISGLDTAAVLFFLAMEFGRAVELLSIEGLFMGITMFMVLVLPFFLPSGIESESLTSWIVGRSIVAAAGVSLGLGISRSAGTFLPEIVAFLPMTLLILASMLSCYIQFYGVMKLRPVK